MILAAGLGTRLGSVGRAVPKALMEIGNRPLLERHLLYLQQLGMRRVVINVHHQAGRIQAYVDQYAGPLEIVCVVERRLLGTAGGVRNALSYLEPGPFIVLYGDVLLEEPIETMLGFHRDRGAVATIAVHEQDSAEGKGVVEVDDSGRVRRFSEKEPGDAGRVLINSGVYVLESEIVAPLERGVVCDFGHDVFPWAVEHGVPVFAYRLRKPVIDIGTPEGLALARSVAGASSGIPDDVS
jgi:mannose-1-phosphate guanylyltransferase